MVVLLSEGGLLSYRHEDGTWTHTLGDGDGWGASWRGWGLRGWSRSIGLDQAFGRQMQQLKITV